MRVETVPTRFSGEVLAARIEHEKRALRTLRTAAFGSWQSFVSSHGLEATNRSLRHSRRLDPSGDMGGESAAATPPPPPPTGAVKQP